MSGENRWVLESQRLMFNRNLTSSVSMEPEVLLKLWTILCDNILVLLKDVLTASNSDCECHYSFSLKDMLTASNSDCECHYSFSLKDVLTASNSDCECHYSFCILLMILYFLQQKNM